VVLWQERLFQLTDYTAELLHFDDVYAVDGVSDRDFAIEFLCAASLIMVHLSRSQKK